MAPMRLSNDRSMDGPQRRLSASAYPSTKYVHQTCGVHNPDGHSRDEGEGFMARRSLLTGEECRLLFGIPNDPDVLARHYTFTRSDQDLVVSRRNIANRLGFAVQLALLRHLGMGLAQIEEPVDALV